jgi:hypothetical protein
LSPEPLVKGGTIRFPKEMVLLALSYCSLLRRVPGGFYSLSVLPAASWVIATHLSKQSAFVVIIARMNVSSKRR